MSPEVRTVFLILVFAAVFSAAQACLGLMQVGRAKLQVNRRLTTALRAQSISDLVIELRKQRGLDSTGKRKLALRWLADLLMVSGLVYRPRKWLIALGAASFTASTLLVALTHRLILAPLGPLIVVALALAALKIIAARRAHLAEVFGQWTPAEQHELTLLVHRLGRDLVPDARSSGVAS